MSYIVYVVPNAPKFGVLPKPSLTKPLNKIRGILGFQILRVERYRAEKLILEVLGGSCNVLFRVLQGDCGS